MWSSLISVSPWLVPVEPSRKELLAGILRTAHVIVRSRPCFRILEFHDLRSGSVRHSSGRQAETFTVSFSWFSNYLPIFLLSSTSFLYSVDVDLSEELRRAATKRQEEQQVKLETVERSKYRAAPTRKEMKAWAKAGKNATGLQVSEPSSGPPSDGMFLE
jgi:hypothetical protein